jgi:hypothetical protein
MTAAILFISAWLGSPNFPTMQAARQETPRGALDVVVFYADPPRDLDRYPLQVRQELRRFVERARAYRPRRRPGRLGSEMRMVYNVREGYEGKLVASAAVAGAAVPGTARLAQQYVDALRPCYEWEGFHDCPEREALFAEAYLRDHPDTPFRDFLRVLAAHRWLCTAEGYEYEQKPAEALRARRSYEEALKIATDSRSALMTTAANELKASGRCHATDPFQRRTRGGASQPAGDTAALAQDSRLFRNEFDDFASVLRAGPGRSNVRLHGML